LDLDRNCLWYSDLPRLNDLHARCLFRRTRCGLSRCQRPAGLFDCSSVCEHEDIFVKPQLEWFDLVLLPLQHHRLHGVLLDVQPDQHLADCRYLPRILHCLELAHHLRGSYASGRGYRHGRRGMADDKENDENVRGHRNCRTKEDIAGKDQEGPRCSAQTRHSTQL